MDRVEMKKSEQEKDLGVLISGTLLWNDQINSCVSKANQMICWITRDLICMQDSFARARTRPKGLCSR